MSDLIEGVKRRHKSARPKRANPAWVHTHSDLGHAIAEIERLRAGLERLASPEAFDITRTTTIEERMRMKYADEVLNG